MVGLKPANTVETGDLIQIRRGVKDLSLSLLCTEGRTGIVQQLFYDENRKVVAVAIQPHCTTAKDPSLFGVRETLIEPRLGGFIGILSSKQARFVVPLHYFLVVEENEYLGRPKPKCDRANHHRNHSR